MIFALIIIVVVFARELIFELSHLGTLNVERVAVLALSLVDLSLIGNLLLVVMLAGYGSFVSPLRIGVLLALMDWISAHTDQRSSAGPSGKLPSR